MLALFPNDCLHSMLDTIAGNHHYHHQSMGHVGTIMGVEGMLQSPLLVWKNCVSFLLFVKTEVYTFDMVDLTTHE